MNNDSNPLNAMIKLTILFILIGGMSLNLNAAPYPASGDFASGSKTWAENCGRCHNLRDPKELRDDQWISTIFHMRVRAGLTGQQARDVITFLQASNATNTRVARTMTVSSSSQGPGVDGKTEYEKSCVACHGADGKGVLPGTPDFTKADGRLSKSDRDLLNNITNGFQSPGSPMAMPPKGGNSNLTSKDIENILKYLRKTFGS